MGKKEDLIESVIQIEEIYTKTIDSVKILNESIPYLSRLKDETGFLLKIIDAIPREVIEKGCDALLETVNSQNLYNRKHIPHISTIEETICMTSTGYVASGCAQGISILMTEQTNYPAQTDIDLKIIEEYEKFQKDTNRISEIKSLLTKISESLFNRFSEIDNYYQKYCNNIIDSESFANYLRNFIYKLQGELVHFINITKKTNYQGFKWELVYKFLPRNGIDSPEYEQLKIMEYIYNKIISDLSSIIKDRHKVDLNYLKNLYIEFISFIYSFLNLIDLK